MGVILLEGVRHEETVVDGGEGGVIKFEILNKKIVRGLYLGT